MVRKASSVVLALVLGFAGVAQAEAVDQSDLRSEIAALKSLVQQQGEELSTLRTQSGETWLNERRTAEVKSLIHEVLSDADTRATLLDDGMTAGHNGHNFYLASADNSFLLTISGLIQARYIYNSRDRGGVGTGTAPGPAPPATVGTGNATSDEDEAGFELARTHLTFAGHINDPRFGYSIGLEATNDRGDVQLHHAYLTYCPTSELTVWVGQAKAPGLREEMVGPGQQLTVDRSLVNEIFSPGRVQGIGAIYSPAALNDMLRLHVSINDGARSGEAGGASGATVNTGTAGSDLDFSEDSSDFSFAARADVKLAGDWDQSLDFSSWSGEPMALFVGGSLFWQQVESGDGQASATGTLGIDSIFQWSLDGSWEWNGWNAFAGLVGRHTKTSRSGGVASVGDNDDSYGLVLQGGYMLIPDKFEPFFRYEMLDLQNSSGAGVGGGSTDDVHILTFGGNYYLNKHNAKFTADVVWALEALDTRNTGGVFSSSGVTNSNSAVGLLADYANQDNQVSFRAQLQLMF